MNWSWAYLVMQIVDSTVTSMWELRADREHRMRPYRLHPIVLEYPNVFQPIGKPIHCCSTHQPCSICRSHCDIRASQRTSVQFTVSNFKEKKKRKRNETERNWKKTTLKNLMTKKTKTIFKCRDTFLLMAAKKNDSQIVQLEWNDQLRKM